MKRDTGTSPEWSSQLEYHSIERFDIERRDLLWNEWMCIGHESTLPEVGSFLSVDLLGESILVVRGEDGVLRSFSNSCRHRGAQLCEREEGRFERLVTCPYHRWAYDLAGRLVAARSMDEHDEFDRSRCGLVPVDLETWRGFLWLCLGSPRQAIGERLEPRVADRFGDGECLDAYRLSTLARGAQRKYSVSANWKIVVENLLECYHCAPVHPGLCRYLPGLASGEDLTGGEAARLADGLDSFTTSGEMLLAPFPDLTRDQARVYYGLVLPPNAMINLFPDHVVSQYIFPQAVDQTLVVCDWLFHVSAVDSPGFDPTPFVDLFDQVNREDWEVCELVQKGTASRRLRSPDLLAPEETQLLDFREYVLRRNGSTGVDR